MNAPAIDTNIVVRLLARDDPAQLAAAELLLDGGVFILSTVLLEVEWVFRSVYGLGPAAIADGLEQLLGLPEVEIENAAAAAEALAPYHAGADFADALHVALSAGRPAFATFDRALAKRFTEAGKPIRLIG